MSESRLQTTEALEALSRRVDALEAHLGLSPAPTVPVPRTEPATGPVADPGLSSSAGLSLAAIGSAVLMLAGAFLLRAITGAGLLAPPVGAGLGLLYIIFLLGVTERQGRLHRRWAANLYGSAAVLVTYPYLWEITRDPALLPGPAGALLTALLTAAALLGAARHRQKALAWLVLLAAEAVLCGLFWTSGTPLPFLAVIIWLGGLTAWQGARGGSSGLRWPAAMVADLLVFLAASLAAASSEAVGGRPHPDPDLTLLASLFLPLIYLGLSSWRTLVRNREVDLFEILQAVVAVGAGLAAALISLRAGSTSTSGLGWACLALAVAAYLVAFRFVRRRQGRCLNFFYFAWLGLVLAMSGSALAGAAGVLPYIWMGLALAAAVAGARLDRWTLRLHCAAFLTGAAVTGHLVADLWRHFAGTAAPPIQAPDPTSVLVLLAAGGCFLVLVLLQPDPDRAAWQRLPRFLVAGTILAGGGVLAVAGIQAVLADRLNVGGLALPVAVRSVVLAGAAVLLAALGRKPRLVELSWWVPPVLVLLVIKVLVQDLRTGSPLSLTVGFACLGLALITTPRLRRRSQEAPPAGGPPLAAPSPSPGDINEV